MKLSKRRGKFKISLNVVEDEPEVVRQIMGRCIIVRCELMYISMHFEYEAISPDFEEVQSHMIAPTYNVLITTDKNSGHEIEFKKLNG